MGWWAELVDDRGHVEGEWNYTHNCNGMANAVIHDDYVQQPVFDEVFRPNRESWWKLLDGMPGPVGAEFLGRIITGLRADPERFCAMNPPNLWGDYDGFVKLLDEMRGSVPEWPCTWKVYG